MSGLVSRVGFALKRLISWEPKKRVRIPWILDAHCVLVVAHLVVSFELQRTFGRLVSVRGMTGQRNGRTSQTEIETTGDKPPKRHGDVTSISLAHHTHHESHHSHRDSHWRHLGAAQWAPPAHLPGAARLALPAKDGSALPESRGAAGSSRAGPHQAQAVGEPGRGRSKVRSLAVRLTT